MKLPKSNFQVSDLPKQNNNQKKILFLIRCLLTNFSETKFHKKCHFGYETSSHENNPYSSRNIRKRNGCILQRNLDGASVDIMVC